MNMKYVLFFMLMLNFTACNNTSKTEAETFSDTTISKPQTDTASKYVHTFSDTALENKITRALLKLPFVIKSNNFIDSFSNHQYGIAFMLENPAANESEIQVQSGYNGKERFETYYRFFVNAKTMEIKVYDPVADKKLTLKEFQKTQQ